MKICKCESCRYIFRYPIVPISCPDCGKNAVRKASADEVREYRRNQAILAKEIREGLYAVG